MVPRMVAFIKIQGLYVTTFHKTAVNTTLATITLRRVSTFRGIPTVTSTWTNSSATRTTTSHLALRPSGLRVLENITLLELVDVLELTVLNKIESDQFDETRAEGGPSTLDTELCLQLSLKGIRHYYRPQANNKAQSGDATDHAVREGSLSSGLSVPAYNSRSLPT